MADFIANLTAIFVTIDLAIDLIEKIIAFIEKNFR